MTENMRDSAQDFRLLAQLALPFCLNQGSQRQIGESPGFAASLSVQDLQRLASLANTNHVILRAFEPLAALLDMAGNQDGSSFVSTALDAERQRIDYALGFLDRICSSMKNAGCRVVVMKSLDHWPDLGSDLDLYTEAQPADVIDLMKSRFGAKLASRSWGDRLANKWNFIVPELSELVEVHVGRLGQTGEQTAITRSLASRTHLARLGRYVFRVPAPEDRIVISTLQRMYRHFYIRLCDVVDNALLLSSNVIDFTYLRSLGLTAGLWDGIATYLTIVSEYVEATSGIVLALPGCVARGATFHANLVDFRRGFLRVPILPQSVSLYASELRSLVSQGEWRNSLRLSLLPCLATAAALGQKITGSDKGVW